MTTTEANANRQILSSFGVDTYRTANLFGAGVKVYVIDSGINVSTLDTAGIEVLDFAGDTTSPSSHGAAIVSLIRGPLNNFGVIGVAPACTLFLADVDEPDGDIFDVYVANAINDAVVRNVDIISISLGTTTFTTRLRDAINGAVNAGILVFAAAGNRNRSSTYEYPASFAGVISVASCDVNRRLSSFTTFNDKVRLVAPGTWILPTGSGYATMQGTSFSAPFCAALAALALSKRRSELANQAFRFTDSQIVAILEDSLHLNVKASDFVGSTGSGGGGAGIVFVMLAVIIVLTLSQGGTKKT